MKRTLLARHLSSLILISCELNSAARAQVTQRVSVDSSGVQGDSDSDIPSISADGRYVAFESGASNLVPGDTNGFADIFVRDRLLGTTERVSIDSGGVQANGRSDFPSISADGRYVAFLSYSTNLVPGDTNHSLDVFVHDRQGGVTERISVDSSGTQGDGRSNWPSISADGRYVAFQSDATNLVAGDTNGATDVFVHDRQTGTTERVSIDSGGVEGNLGSYASSISADGRYVAFTSDASNLVLRDTNGFSDIFVHDRQTGTTERVSIDSGGAQARGFSDICSISADGRYVAFASYATNLVAADTNGTEDIFVHDRQSGVTERVSVDSSGVQGNSASFIPSISADGRYVAFLSIATNLIPGGTNNGGSPLVFGHDRQAGTTELVSLNSSGSQAEGLTGGFGLQSISADGRFVAFSSLADNLVHGDRNGAYDIFVRDRIGGTAFIDLCDPAVGGVIACPCSNSPSGLGRGCDNSSGTGGAILSAIGGTYLSSDSLEFQVTGEMPNALSMLLQGTALIPSGVVYGQGVRCVGGAITRIFTKRAVSSGSLTVPDFAVGESTVSLLSEAKGDPISAGQSRYYLVLYRDPIVLGGCPASSTFNATQTGMVTWSP